MQVDGVDPAPRRMTPAASSSAHTRQPQDSSSRVTTAFRNRAKTYEADTPWVTDGVVTDHALELLGKNPIGDLLDAGGGTGALAARVIATLGCRSSVVVDASPDMLAEVPTDIGRVEATLETFLETARPEYDTITVRQVLHYLEQPWCVLRRLTRLLRPGGHLYVGQVVAPDEAAAEWLQGQASLLSPARRHHFELAEFSRRAVRFEVALEEARVHRYVEDLEAWSKRASGPLDLDLFVRSSANDSMTDEARASLRVDGAGRATTYQVLWWHGLFVAG